MFSTEYKQVSHLAALSFDCSRFLAVSLSLPTLLPSPQPPFLSLLLFLCVFFYLFAGFCLFPLRLVKMAVILNVVVECVDASLAVVIVVISPMLLLLIHKTYYTMSHSKNSSTCTSRLLFGNKFAG